MPLTGPVSQGTKFFCPRCGALYSVTHRQTGKNESTVTKCVVCETVMNETASAAVPVYTLIHRPEDA